MFNSSKFINKEVLEKKKLLHDSKTEISTSHVSLQSMYDRATYIAFSHVSSGVFFYFKFTERYIIPN